MHKTKSQTTPKKFLSASFVNLFMSILQFYQHQTAVYQHLD